MELQTKALYEKINAFALDESGSADPFTRRLARENRWTSDYASRVVREYRRFVLLAVTAPHTAVPSDAVDQVWHLHLGYTANYWCEFCLKVLGRALHHHPSRGGQTEYRKYSGEYAKTLASYRALFGEEAPCDIWPEPERRFGNAAQCARVNLAEHWVISKPRAGLTSTRSLAVLVPVGVGAFAFAMLALLVPMPYGPSPAQFTVLYVAVWLTSLAVAAWVRRARRRGQDGDVPLHPIEIAYLASGERRALRVALLGLSAAGSVVFDPERRAWTLAGPVPENAHPFARAVYEQIETLETATNRALAPRLSGRASEIERRLQELGLMTKPGLDPALAIALLPVATGALKLILGSVQGERVGHVLALCSLSAVIALYRFGAHARLTAAGERKRVELEAANQAWRTRAAAASTASSVVSTVAALWGVQVLLETDAGELGALLPDGLGDDAGDGDGDGDSEGGGDSDGGDSDGGGEGGCGGCGGGCSGCG